MIPHDPLSYGGWKFYMRHIGPAKFKRFSRDYHLEIPFFTNDYGWHIRHLDSGIEFKFSAIDALQKWKEELETEIPIHSTWPTYSSPFPPSPFDFDSAYVGKVLIEKSPGQTPQEWCPEWEDIDLATLPELIARSIRNEQISGYPTSVFYRESRRIRPVRKESKAKDLLKPLFNYLVPVYRGDSLKTDHSCYFHLVVTHSGWFVSLCQQLLNYDGCSRIREMTMHCYFEENIVYREIIESQSMFFEEELPKVWIRYKDHDKKRWDQDDEMCVHFHEAKQFRIREACMGVSSSCSARGAQRYSSSFTFRKLKKAHLGVVDVSDEKIGLLTANCGKKMKSIEAKTGTCIQVIPLFCHPYHPYIGVLPGKKPGKVPRRAYIDGLENNIEHARCCLRKLLRNRQLCSVGTDFESESESETEWETETEWESATEGESEAERRQFARKTKMIMCNRCGVCRGVPGSFGHWLCHLAFLLPRPKQHYLYI